MGILARRCGITRRCSGMFVGRAMTMTRPWLGGVLAILAALSTGCDTHYSSESHLQAEALAVSIIHAMEEDRAFFPACPTDRYAMKVQIIELGEPARSPIERCLAGSVVAPHLEFVLSRLDRKLQLGPAYTARFDHWQPPNPASVT